MAIELPKKAKDANKDTSLNQEQEVQVQENIDDPTPICEAATAGKMPNIRVMLLPTSPNEMVGHHNIYTTYGAFLFVDGYADIAEPQAAMLKKDGYIK